MARVIRSGFLLCRNKCRLLALGWPNQCPWSMSAASVRQVSAVGQTGSGERFNIGYDSPWP